jgi:hypothetical protein
VSILREAVHEIGAIVSLTFLPKAEGFPGEADATDETIGESVSQGAESIVHPIFQRGAES